MCKDSCGVCEIFRYKTAENWQVYCTSELLRPYAYTLHSWSKVLKSLLDHVSNAQTRKRPVVLRARINTEIKCSFGPSLTRRQVEIQIGCATLNDKSAARAWSVHIINDWAQFHNGVIAQSTRVISDLSRVNSLPISAKNCLFNGCLVK